MGRGRIASGEEGDIERKKKNTFKTEEKEEREGKREDFRLRVQ